MHPLSGIRMGPPLECGESRGRTEGGRAGRTKSEQKEGGCPFLSIHLWGSCRGGATPQRTLGPALRYRALIYGRWPGCPGGSSLQMRP